MRPLARSRWLVVTPQRRLIPAEISVNQRKPKPWKLAGKPCWNWPRNARRASTSIARPGSSSCGEGTKTERLEPCWRWRTSAFSLAKGRQRAWSQPNRRCNYGPRRKTTMELPGCVRIWEYLLLQEAKSRPRNATTTLPEAFFTGWAARTMKQVC